MQFKVISNAYSDAAADLAKALPGRATCQFFPSIPQMELSLQAETLLSIPEILLLETDDEEECFQMIDRIRKNVLLSGMIIVLLDQAVTALNHTRARQLKIHDYYSSPYPVEDICERLAFLVKYKLSRPSLIELLKGEENVADIKLPIWKRVFDIGFSATLLILLCPLLLLTALLIRLESRGPVVYRSKRVGTGYQIFDFYKFRSMYPDSDKRLAEVSARNQYRVEDNAASTVFTKVIDDPRITRVGRIIRRYSIDELPQLFNILNGDMSTVGNRPLPLYEAEMLTSNEWSWRFLAPSGLTGLWQISRRGNASMSERERKKLDNFYAKKYSLLFDLRILLKTLPAAFQKENV